jgi:hypothetical protein
VVGHIRRDAQVLLHEEHRDRALVGQSLQHLGDLLDDDWG